MPISTSSSTTTSARLFAAQLNALAVPESGLEAAELKNARLVDPSVTAEDISQVRSRIAAAQARFFSDGHATITAETTVLFCPTAAVVDIPISLSTWRAITSRTIAESSESQLQRMVEEGPGGSAIHWQLCETPQQLVASVVRWAEARGKEKLRIRASSTLRTWVQEAIADAGLTPEPKLGGVSAVGSVLVHALGGKASMFCTAPVSEAVLPLLPAEMQLVVTSGATTSAGEYSPAHSIPPNFAIEWDVKDAACPTSGSTKDRLLTPASAVDILITSGERRPAFEGLSTEVLCSLGSNFDVAVVNGVQHLQTKQEVHEYLNSLHALRAGGTPLGLLFTEPRFEAARGPLYSALLDNPTFEFIGMNANEAHALLLQLLHAARGRELGAHSDAVQNRLQFLDDEHPQEESCWGTCKEAPIAVLNHALLLQDILKIPLVRVRSHSVDILVSAFSPSDPERVRDHLIISRNLGTLKVAHHEGILNSADDIQPLKNLPDGAHIAALHLVAAALRERASKACDPRDPLQPATPQIPLESSFWTRLPDGRAVFAIPPVPFYDVTGGKVSAGDTQDSSFLAAEADGLLQEARRSTTTSMVRAFHS